MVSAKDFETIRSIVRAGGDYDLIKRLLGATRWEIEADEVELGFLRLFIPDPEDEYYRLIIGYRDPNRPPFVLLTFFLFPDSEDQVPAFNSAFDSTAETLTQYFGPPSLSGHRRMSSRTWPYSHRRWSLPEGEFTLVQDEFDIQDGMDVTLWMQPVGTAIEETAC
jgi:hypothetical protein